MRISVDIGGTKTMIGLIDEAGVILDRRRIASKDYSSPKALVSAVSAEATELLGAHGLRPCDICHFGVGVPGTADWENGIVLYSPNLMGENVPLADYLEEALGMRPTIVQDSWAGAYAEYLFGQKKAYQDMMCITLGTGIGCGIIRSGRVFSGAMRTAGEIGHVSIDPHGRLCSCGRRGCLETYASGTGIYMLAAERFGEDMAGLPQNAETVFAMARQGHPKARELLGESSDRLAFGIAALIDIFSCADIFISGGLAGYEEYFVTPLSEKIRAYGYPGWSRRFAPFVRRAALGYDAPFIGAAFLSAGQIA